MDQYILGLLYALGSKHGSGTRFQTRDRTLAKYFSKITNLPICHSGGIYSVYVNKKIFNTRKKVAVNIPIIDWDFLRGLFDGKASLYLSKGYLNISLTYHEDLIEQIRFFLKQNGINSRVYQTYSYSTSSKLVISSSRKLLFSLMYARAYYYFGRKFQQYKKALKKSV